MFFSLSRCVTLSYYALSIHPRSDSIICAFYICVACVLLMDVWSRYKLFSLFPAICLSSFVNITQLSVTRLMLCLQPYISYKNYTVNHRGTSMMNNKYRIWIYRKKDRKKNVIYSQTESNDKIYITGSMEYVHVGGERMMIWHRGNINIRRWRMVKILIKKDYVFRKYGVKYYLLDLSAISALSVFICFWWSVSFFTSSTFASLSLSLFL